jgi:hypothetical protein
MFYFCIHAIVIKPMLTVRILPPDLDPEGGCALRIVVVPTFKVWGWAY